MSRIALVLATLASSMGAVQAQEYVPKTGFKPVVVPRPGDQGVYTLLDAYRQGPYVISIDKRVGPSGVTYTRRRIDCASGLVLALGTGETVEGMMLERPDPQEAVPVSGSSAQFTSTAACRGLGL